MKIKVGLCGFSVAKKKLYSSKISVVEIQKTFYGFPRETTLTKWRNEAPEAFEFTVKASMLITHIPSMPIYRKSRIEIPKEKYELYGFFKPTDEVFNALDKTLSACKLLKARICVFQTPAKFKPSDENIQNMTKFFHKARKNEILFGWESRGWPPDISREICEKLGLIEITDPFSRMPQAKSDIYYFRLHGSPPGKRMYSYKYTEKDLKELIDKISTLSAKEVYIMFNNIYMFDDAISFISLLEKH